MDLTEIETLYAIRNWLKAQIAETPDLPNKTYNTYLNTVEEEIFHAENPETL